MSKRKGKVFVAMSGGVDSSVSAWLLKKGGYDVTGVFIKVWEPDFHLSENSSKNICTWREDRRDAMRVAAHLDIPLVTLDLGKEYKKVVIDYMLSEYKKGRTPNPDIMCNKQIKFGVFFERALTAGADFVATGHYAHIKQSMIYNQIKTVSRIKQLKYKLMTGVDTEKDQSYFLWTLTQRHLSRTIFPVGLFKKTVVRDMAKVNGLATADKKDSQGLCFVGKLDMKKFLKHYIKVAEGKVLDTSGQVIGSHSGAVFYTLGERHGFSVFKKGRNSKPLYVVKNDINNNTITVANSFSSSKIDQTSVVKIDQTNWIGVIPIAGSQYQARVRYRQPLLNCIVRSLKKNYATIEFSIPVLSSPGQSLVLYNGDECVGGGVIAH